MITDWLKITYLLGDISIWRAGINHKIYALVDIDSGEIKEETGGNWKFDEKRNLEYQSFDSGGEFQHYKFIITETLYRDREGNRLPSTHRLTITGSLHCNSFNGSNHQRFTFQQLVEQIELIKSEFNIDIAKAEIHSLETGINIFVLFPVFPFLQDCLLQSRGKSFQKMKSKSGCIGYEECTSTQIIKKAYDKGLQHSLSENVLRWELHFNKMQPIVKLLSLQRPLMLSDLLNPFVIDKLFQNLLREWNNVFVYDPNLPLSNPSIAEKQKGWYQKCGYRDYWQKYKRDRPEKFKDERNRCRNFIKKYTKSSKTMHEQILHLMMEEFRMISDSSINIPAYVPLDKADHFPDFTSSVRGNIGEIISNDDIVSKKGNIEVKEELSSPISIPIPQRRYCLSCNKEITHQSIKSKYCSAKYAGEKQAKQCRNKISNEKHNRKRRNNKRVLTLLNKIKVRNQTTYPDTIKERRKSANIPDEVWIIDT